MNFTNDSVLVPSLDEEVRSRLRSLDEPITLFGEDNASRRARLERLIKLSESLKVYEIQNDEVEDEIEVEEEVEEEEFWTPGPEELIGIRKQVADYSIKETKRRLALENHEYKIDFTEKLKLRRQINDKVSKYELVASNIVSSRTVSSIKYSPSGSLVAVGSWSGDLKILNSETLQPEEFVGAPIKHYHDQIHNKVTGLDWNKNHLSPVQLVTNNSNNFSVHLWSLDSPAPLATMKGHENRVVQTKFHPLGSYVASSSYDKTWRFWDVEKGQEIYLQEGHAKEVHAVSFQPNGALLASGGLDAIGKIWDLRTGKCIMSLTDHIQGILAIDWSENGYQLATGSKDCTIKIWDLRYTSNAANNTSYNEYIQCDKPLFTIPAHTKMVSSLRFSHSNNFSPLLVSTGFDGTIRVWSADNWINVATLKGHTDNKITDCDIHPSFGTIASSGWDKSVRLWSS